MQTYRFSELTEETLSMLVSLNKIAGVSEDEDWEQMQITLTAEEGKRIDIFRADLEGLELIAMNEATLWCRVVYPLLVIAERAPIRAWAGVPLKATYPAFQLEGEADGALASCIWGRMSQPYLVVHETKRGVNAPDPLYQLLGEMLAAAWLNWKKDANPEPEIFGCYTVAGSWAFVRGVVGEIDTEKPTFAVEKSRTYDGVSDAERIVQILKAIVTKQRRHAMQEVVREQIPLNKHPVNQWAKRHLQQIPPDALEEYSNEPHRLKPGETSSQLYLLSLLWYGLQYRQRDNPDNYRSIERKLMELDMLPPKEAWEWMMGTNAGPLTVPPPTDPMESDTLWTAADLVDWFRGILFHERMEAEEALEVYPAMRMPAHLPPQPNSRS